MENIMKNFEEKPYNMCLNCAHIGKRCDGPNFLAMDMKRLSEWCRLRKDYLHNMDYRWTNEYIAEQADLSKSAVDKFLSGKNDDIRVSTISSIIKVLINGTWGQYPCAMGAVEKETIYVDNPDIIAECKRLKESVKTVQQQEQEKNDNLRKQIMFLEDQILKKDNLLKERADYLRLKDRFIRWLTISLAAMVTIILIAVVIDYFNKNIGFLWVDQIAATIKGNNMATSILNNTMEWRL